MKARNCLIAILAALAGAGCSPSSGSGGPSPSDGHGHGSDDPSQPYDRTFLTFPLDRPILGTAGTFGVLGGQAVTNTGPTTVNGDVGVWPGSAIPGLADITIIGHAAHLGDVEAQQAQSDVTIAYDALAAQAPTLDLTSQDLGGMTLVQGVYSFTSSAQLTGTLVLDAQGDDTAIWIFQIGSALTTASNSTVSVINGGQNCAVFWKVGSSATLGTDTTFKGNILALTSIALMNGATLIGGRALARNGEVTLDSNDISAMACTDIGPSQPCD